MYALMLLLSAIAINGFFNITRGKWETQPDGTTHWVGKIFSGWSKFLNQHRETKEYYTGDQWYKEFGKLTAFFGKEEVIEVFTTGVVVQKMDAKRQGWFDAFVAVNGIKFSSRDYGSGKLISTYRLTKKYTFPMWFRAPMGECLACMSSVFGTGCWIMWYRIAGVVNQGAAKTLTEMPMIGILGLWALFCFSLAYLNELIFSINSKLQR